MGIPADVFPFAVGTALSPLPLLVLLIVLLTPRAVPNGLAFALGWAVALLVVGGVTVAVLGAGAGFDEQGAVVSLIEVFVGCLLLVLAVRQWFRRPRGGAEAVVPRWLQVADRCTPPRAFAMGSVLVLANPKNLALTVAAAGTVAGTSAAKPTRSGVGAGPVRDPGYGGPGRPARAPHHPRGARRPAPWRAGGGGSSSTGHRPAAPCSALIGVLLVLRGAAISTHPDGVRLSPRGQQACALPQGCATKGPMPRRRMAAPVSDSSPMRHRPGRPAYPCGCGVG